MKKVYVAELQEILNTHITGVQDYLEQAITLLMDPFLQVSSGVVTNLAVSSGVIDTIVVATGSIYQDGVFGQLESASGLVLSLPSSGTRTDLIVAYYQEVLDSPSSGFVLLDVSTGQEAVQTNPTRKFGAVRIQQLTGTTYVTRPSNKIPLCEIVVNSSGLVSLTDARIYSRITRLQMDLKLNFRNMFYSGF